MWPGLLDWQVFNDILFDHTVTLRGRFANYNTHSIHVLKSFHHKQNFSINHSEIQVYSGPKISQNRWLPVDCHWGGALPKGQDYNRIIVTAIASKGWKAPGRKRKMRLLRVTSCLSRTYAAEKASSSSTGGSNSRHSVSNCCWLSMLRPTISGSVITRLGWLISHDLALSL